MGKNLNSKEEDVYLNKLLDRINEIGQIKNPVQQLNETLNLKFFLSDIFEDGYKKGFNACMTSKRSLN